MDRNKIEDETMHADWLEDILASDEEVATSFGFLAAVMERVEQEAAAPVPIPFPWKRAIPGIVLAAVVFGWGALEFVKLVVGAARGASLTNLPQLPLQLAQPLQQAGWVALAAVVSVASWILARGLAGASGPSY
jgi:hypothetical protein